MSGRKREREAPEVGAMAGRVVRALVKRAADGDSEALEELLKLAELIPAAIRDAGVAMHRFGYTYTELGDIAGISRQAARERFAMPQAAEPVRFPWDDTPSSPAIPATTDTTEHDARMGVAQ